jgi:hypothetical protein
MKTNFTNSIFASIAILLIAGCASMTHAQSPAETTDKDALITWTASGKQSGNVDVLFVQNAKDVTFKRESSSCKE